MPSLDEHQSAEFTKLVYLGDSGSGKTGSLVSLVAAGYKLRILDLDNGLDALVQQVRLHCPDKLKNVGFITIRDKYKGTASGPIVSGTPKAFVDTVKYLDKWEDDSVPSEWGPDYVLVLDSGSAFGKAAFEWAKGMNPTAKDPRQWYGSAQAAVENTIALLTGESFRANVIIISHVDYRELVEGVNKGYANFIGAKTGALVPKYFNTMVMAESVGSGKNTKRRIKTMPTGVVDLKTPVPSIEAEYPLETGLATIFEKLKGK